MPMIHFLASESTETKVITRSSTNGLQHVRFFLLVIDDCHNQSYRKSGKLVILKQVLMLYIYIFSDNLLKIKLIYVISFR